MLKTQASSYSPSSWWWPSRTLLSFLPAAWGGKELVKVRPYPDTRLDTHNAGNITGPLTEADTTHSPNTKQSLTQNPRLSSSMSPRHDLPSDAGISDQDFLKLVTAGLKRNLQQLNDSRKEREAHALAEQKKRDKTQDDWGELVSSIVHCNPLELMSNALEGLPLKEILWTAAACTVLYTGVDIGTKLTSAFSQVHEDTNG